MLVYFMHLHKNISHVQKLRHHGDNAAVKIPLYKSAGHPVYIHPGHGAFIPSHLKYALLG